MRDYKKILAYKSSDELVKEIYELTRSFPKDELYGLVSQIRRAIVSVVVNIVEGSSRKHKKEYLNFLYISRGSLAETEYLLKLSHDLKYIDGVVFEDMNQKITHVFKVLYGLINSVEDEL
jgi:four helix bundle protein